MDQLLLADQSPVSFSRSVVNEKPLWPGHSKPLKDNPVPFHLHSLQQSFHFSGLRIFYNAEFFLECVDGT